MSEHPTAGSLPEFATIEEEAEFWDTHDITDYLGELKPVEVRFARHLSEGITIRLDPEAAVELRDIAEELGVGPTALMRMWVMERLNEVKQERATKEAGAAGHGA